MQSILFFWSGDPFWMPAVRGMLYRGSGDHIYRKRWAYAYRRIPLCSSSVFYWKLSLSHKDRIQYQRTCRWAVFFLCKRVYNLSGSSSSVQNLSFLVWEFTFCQKMETHIQRVSGYWLRPLIFQKTDSRNCSFEFGSCCKNESLISAPNRVLTRLIP